MVPFRPFEHQRTGFCLVSTDGSAYSYYADCSWALAPCFLSNRRSISGKIPPTEVGGKPGQRKKTREVKECQF